MQASAVARAEYVGGTSSTLASGEAGSLDAKDEQYLAFYTRKEQIRVPFSRINLLEYGQQVDRRLALAVVLSPVFLLSKKRRHFLTIGYTPEGKQQALVFRVDKNAIRATLATLEARTGVKITFQDQEARKASGR
jgi:hypothetical protein